MSSNLQTTVAEFCRLYQRARAERNGSINALRLHATTLENFFRAVQDEAQRSKNAAGAFAFDKLEATLKVDDAIELRQFFLNVSNSLMEAQDELNRLSGSYSATPASGAAPARFAIPNARAEMKVGFRELSSRGVNLLLFRNQEESQTYGESTISFDLVATPPLADAKPSFPPALTGAAKLALLGRLRELAGARGLGELGGELGKKIYANTQEQAAVLRYPIEGCGEPRFLVLWPGRNENELDSPQSWRTLLLFAVEVTAGGDVALIPEIFDGSQPPTFLLLTSLTELSGRPAADLAMLAIRLGDVMVNAAEIVRRWIEPSQQS